MSLHFTLLTIGCLILVGLLADTIGRRTMVPRVTLLILFGVIAGPSGFDVLPSAFSNWYETLATIALTMVAFLLGGVLSAKNMRANGVQILTISLSVVFLTIFLVGGGLMMIGVTAPLALLLAGIATATAPAATQDVVRQTGAKGPFTKTLLGIVAVDDAWGLIAFSFILVAAKAQLGGNGIGILGDGMREVGIAALIGMAVGFPAAYLTGRLRRGEPMQAEAIGIVFICAGLATWFGASFLLAGMIAGAIVVNFARHHERAFHEIEQIEWPFMVLFFILAGASLEFKMAEQIGIIGVACLILRFVARVCGGWTGAWLSAAPSEFRRWIGVALMPQAGVALGMALVASSHIPEFREVLLVTTIGTTVVFEIIGPPMTQIALRAVGENN
ncbi:MAG: cation:proton antiporter [Hyphomicrobiales bacterium]|nr:cation:proton antiporter [Hyphomicrobiales bacterium]MCP4997273.1 cation:proton antiporter [Hyphomicrobiales bacterium]